MTDTAEPDLSKAVFSASIPNIMSGIKTGSDGMRLQLDIPESDMGEAVKLLAMRGKRLVVTVEIWTDFDNEAKKEPERGDVKMDNRRIRDRRNK
jgi:hypothetical protein